MSFKRGLPEILGKRITGYIVTSANRSPKYQFYLAFDDGTTYEIYSETVISGAGGVDHEDIDQVLERYSQGGVLQTRRIDPTETPYGPQQKLFDD